MLVLLLLCGSPSAHLLPAVSAADAVADSTGAPLLPSITASTPFTTPTAAVAVVTVPAGSTVTADPAVGATAAAPFTAAALILGPHSAFVLLLLLGTPHARVEGEPHFLDGGLGRDPRGAELPLRLWVPSEGALDAAPAVVVVVVVMVVVVQDGQAAL